MTLYAQQSLLTLLPIDCCVLICVCTYRRSIILGSCDAVYCRVAQLLKPRQSDHDMRTFRLPPSNILLDSTTIVCTLGRERLVVVCHHRCSCWTYVLLYRTLPLQHRRSSCCHSYYYRLHRYSPVKEVHLMSSFAYVLQHEIRSMTS